MPLARQLLIMSRRTVNQPPTGRRTGIRDRRQPGHDRRKGERRQGYVPAKPKFFSKPGLKSWAQRERTAWRWAATNFITNVWRYALTALAFPFGALILLLMNPWYEGVEKTSTKHEVASRLPKVTILAGPPDKAKAPDDVNDPYRVQLPTFPLSKVDTLPGMVCTPRLDQLVAFALPDGGEVTRKLSAFGPNAREVFPGLPIVAKDGTRVPEDSTQPYKFGSTQTVTISADLAAKLGIKSGSQATLLPRNTGVNPETAPVTLHRFYDPNPYNGNTLFGSYGLALHLLGKITPENRVLADLIATELDCTFPESMGSPEEIAAQLRAKNPEFKVSTFAERGFYLHELDRGSRTLQIITTLVIGLMSIFGAYSFISSSLSGRKEEIHNMSLLGLTPAEIGKIVRREYQAAILGGSTLYTGLGLAWGDYLSRVGIDLSSVGMTEGGPALGFPLSYQVYGQNNYAHALVAWLTIQVMGYVFLRAGIHKFVQYPKVTVPSEAAQDQSPVGQLSQDQHAGIRLQGVETILKRGAEKQLALRIGQLAINKGDFAVIMGPSGGGKTTLLETIAGLVPPSQGVVEIKRLRISDFSKPEERKAARKTLKLATISQDLGLFGHLTVRQTIEFALRAVQDMSSSSARQKADQVMTRMNLLGLQDEQIETLSGGERARVAIARALAFDPEIILLDEPTKSLDIKAARDFEDMLDVLNEQEGLTIVEVSHRDVAVRTNRTCLWLDRGQLGELPAEYQIMLKRQELVAMFSALKDVDPSLEGKLDFGVQTVGMDKFIAHLSQRTADLEMVQEVLRKFQGEQGIEVEVKIKKPVAPKT